MSEMLRLNFRESPKLILCMDCYTEIAKLRDRHGNVILLQSYYYDNIWNVPTLSFGLCASRDCIVALPLHCTLPSFFFQERA